MMLRCGSAGSAARGGPERADSEALFGRRPAPPHAPHTNVYVVGAARTRTHMHTERTKESQTADTPRRMVGIGWCGWRARTTCLVVTCGLDERWCGGTTNARRWVETRCQSGSTRVCGAWRIRYNV